MRPGLRRDPKATATPGVDERQLSDHLASGEHQASRQSVGGANPPTLRPYRNEQHTPRQQSPQPYRTPACPPSSAHDPGAVAPNDTHAARDNTNSDVQPPRTVTATPTRSYLMTTTANVSY